MQLEIILGSLLDHRQVSSMLGYSSTEMETDCEKHSEVVQKLMRRLLENIVFFTVTYQH